MWQNHIGNVTTRGKKRKSKNLVKMLWKIQPNGIIRKEHLAEFPDASMKTNALLWRKKNSSWRKKEWEKVLGCEYFRFRQWQHLFPPANILVTLMTVCTKLSCSVETSWKCLSWSIRRHHSLNDDNVEKSRHGNAFEHQSYINFAPSWKHFRNIFDSSDLISFDSFRSAVLQHSRVHRLHLQFPSVPWHRQQKMRDHHYYKELKFLQLALKLFTWISICHKWSRKFSWPHYVTLYATICVGTDAVQHSTALTLHRAASLPCHALSLR